MAALESNVTVDPMAVAAEEVRILIDEVEYHRCRERAEIAAERGVPALFHAGRAAALVLQIEGIERWQGLVLQQRAAQALLEALIEGRRHVPHDDALSVQEAMERRHLAEGIVMLRDPARRDPVCHED